jgi:hypothetical protein
MSGAPATRASSPPAADKFGNDADSDEAGRLFQGEAGHPFRFHSGQCSELKPDTLLV